MFLLLENLRKPIYCTAVMKNSNASREKTEIKLIHSQQSDTTFCYVFSFQTGVILQYESLKKGSYTSKLGEYEKVMYKYWKCSDTYFIVVFLFNN